MPGETPNTDPNAAVKPDENKPSGGSPEQQAAAAAAAKAAADAAAASLSAFQQKTATVLDASKPVAERIAAANEVLAQTHKHFTPAQREEWIKANITGEDDALPEVKNDPADPVGSKVAELERQVAEMKKVNRKARGIQLEGHLSQSLKAALDSNPELSTIVSAAVRLQGESKKPEVVASMTADLRKRALSRLTELTSQGQELSESLISDVIAKEVPSVAGLYRSVIGDPSSLGRASETAGMAYLRQNPKPIEVPKADQALGDLDVNMERWVQDQLMRASHSTEGGSTFS